MKGILGTGRTFRLRTSAIAAGACVLVALPLCFARINPLLRSQEYARRQRERLAELRKRQSDLAGSLAAQRRRLGDLRKALRAEKIQLVSAGSVNHRIAKLTDLAAGSGLSVDEILPGEPARVGLYETVPVSLTASGSYPTCVAFLRKLKETFPDTSVASFDLSGRPEEPGAPAEFRVELLWHTTPRGRIAQQ